MIDISSKKQIKIMAMMLFLPFFTTLFVYSSLLISVNFTYFICSLWIILSKPTVKCDNIINNILVALFVSGTVVGLLYTTDNKNDVIKYLIYSLLSFGYIVSFRAGYKLSATPYVITFMIFMFISDILLYIPYLIYGEYARSSIGISRLFPLVLFVILEYGLSIKYKNILFCFFFINTVIIIFSRLRSALILYSLCIICILIYCGNNLNVLKKIIFILFATVFIYSISSTNMKNLMSERIEFVFNRISNTLLADNAKLDEEGGRSLEAEKALREFYKRDGIFPEIIGYGHGFSYRLGSEIEAHIHITPVAFFVRYGIIGVFLYLIICLTIFFKTVKLFFKKRNIRNGLVFSLLICANFFIVSSFIAGSLTQLNSWFIIGIAFGSYRNMKKHQQS